MESNFIIPTISCSTHPGEPIVRVSLDINDEKLFFCYECLEKNKKPNLVKFQDVIPTLLNQYSNQSSLAVNSTPSTNLKDLLAYQNEFHAEFSDHICQQKDNSDEEIQKLQRQFIKLLQRVRAGTYEKLDQFGKSFNKLYDEYSHTIQAYEELLSNFSKDVPTQIELDLKIFNTDSTQEAEKNLREVLEDLKTLKDIKEGTALEKTYKIKVKLEQAAETFFLIPEKNEKEYFSNIQVLETYLEGLVAGKKKEDKQEERIEIQEEFERQMQASDNLIQVLEDFGKKIEASNQKIDALLEEKFDVKVLEPVCTVSKSGSEPVNGKAYKCLTCLAKYQIAARNLVCEGCKDVCHKGHQIEFLETKDFVCQCQFTMRDCKLAVSCTYKYTGRSYVKQAYFICKTDRMGIGNCICTFCMKNCHKGHELTFISTDPAFCDCQALFSFCKYHTEK